VVDGKSACCRRSFVAWAGKVPAGATTMRFDEREIGDYRIFAGALEALKGDGYTATMIVQRVHGAAGGPREVLRDEGLACGHRWESADAALAYAINKAQEAIRKRSELLPC
jgi:hypothetical protein